MEIRTVAFLNWRYPGGGGETVTHHLGHFFLRHGYRIAVFGELLFEDIISDEDRKAFTIRTVPHLPGSRKIDKEAFCRSLKELKTDCLIVQGITNTPFEEIHREVGCKIIFCLHSIPLWEVHAIRNRRTQDLLRQTFWHKLEFWILRRPINRLTDKPKRRILKIYARILPHIDRMIMLCPEYRDRMEQEIQKSGYLQEPVPGRRFLAISNPLLPASEPTRCPKQKSVLYVGRLCYEDKRVDRLLRIWKRVERDFPDWKLQIVGRGDEMDRLRQLTGRLRLRNVEFLGHQTDVAPFYRQATFICLTSNFEGQPMSLIEGQQYGAIPVSFDSFAAIRQITQNGEAGIMVPAFSIRRYAERLKAAMRDEKAREHMRENCYRQAENYNLERIGNEWLRLFDELARE